MHPVMTCSNSIFSEQYMISSRINVVRLLFGIFNENKFHPIPFQVENSISLTIVL